MSSGTLPTRKTDYSAVKAAIHRKLIQKLNLDRLGEIKREDVRREVAQILEGLVVGEDPEADALVGDDRKEAEKRDAEARIWISGIEAVKAKIGVRAIFDLSATPFFLRGSGYNAVIKRTGRGRRPRLQRRHHVLNQQISRSRRKVLRPSGGERAASR